MVFKWLKEPVLKTGDNGAQAPDKPGTYGSDTKNFATNSAISWAELAQQHPELALLVAAWPVLPEGLRRRLTEVAWAALHPSGRQENPR